MKIGTMKTWGFIVPPALPDAIREGVEEHAATADAIYLRRKEQVEALRGDKRFTAEGRRDQFAVLSRDADQEITRFFGPLSYREKIAEFEGKLVATVYVEPSTEQKLLREIRQQELRRYALSLTTEERDALYVKATLEGPEEYLEAIDSARWPLIDKLVTPAIRQQYREQRYERTHPDVWPMVEGYRLAGKTMKHMEDALRRALTQEGLELRVDPLAAFVASRTS